MKARGVRVFVTLVILFLGIRFFMGQPAPTPKVFAGAMDYPAAIMSARDSGKPVLAFVTADWCEPCQALKRGALADAGVAAWIKDNTHAVYIDATNANEDAQRLNVTSLPTLVALREGANGAIEVSRLSGVVEKAELLDWLASFSGPAEDYKAKHATYPPGYTPK